MPITAATTAQQTTATIARIARSPRPFVGSFPDSRRLNLKFADKAITLALPQDRQQITHEQQKASGTKPPTHLSSYPC
jgi:hypothetical protein